ANNICVQESDRENDRDGDTGWINGTAECAKRIREYAHPTDAELLEMLDEAGANAAKAALEAAREDAERLDSGTIRIIERDEFGMQHTTAYSGVDLRAAIDQARGKGVQS